LSLHNAIAEAKYRRRGLPMAGGRAQASDGDELKINEIARHAFDLAGRVIWVNHGALLAVGTEVGATSQSAGHSWTLANFLHTLDTALNPQ
jgi:hypothetical protein